MLPKPYQKRYQEFFQTLQQLQDQVAVPEPDQSTLQGDLTAAQQQFQQDILSLGLEGVPETHLARVQSYQTEINKQLRLLGMDILFLQAARQSATVQQRQAQMSDRIRLLIQYCEALL